MDVLTISLRAAAPVVVLPDVRLKIAARSGAGEEGEGGCMWGGVVAGEP